MSNPKKYVFDNGVMKLNPEYMAWKAAQNGSQPVKQTGDQPLAIVSSMSDVAEATSQQQQSTGTTFQLSESTVSSMEIIQDEEFTNQFQQPGGVDGSELLEGTD